MNKVLNNVASYFSFKERGATFKKEIIGGLSTFLAMAYILAVNPGMLSNSNGGHNYAGVFFLGTAIAAMVSTIAMGLFANVPIALAPGMGVNAFFTYTVASSVLGMTVEQALIATFCSGILYAIVAITPLRTLIARMLPKNMKLAIGAMIGLFLAYIGLIDSGIFVSGASQIPGAPHVSFGTPTKIGNFKDPFVLIAIITMILVFILHFLKIKGGAIIAIFAGVIMLAIAKAAGVNDASKAFQIQDYKSFGKFGELSKGMWSSFGSAMSNGKFYIAVFVFLYVDFFDTTGTLFSVGEQAKLNDGPDKGEKWMAKANMVDAAGTIFGSVMLTSTTTSYVESTVGVSQGARTGFSSVITGLLFGLAIAIWPIMSPVMPIEHAQSGLGAYNDGFAPTIQPVTGPILVLVGALMISQLKHFEWVQVIDIPVLFVTLVFGMLGYSISTGIAAGVVLYYLINSVALAATTIQRKRGKEFVVNDEEMPTANVKPIKVQNPEFKARVVNPVMITLFVLAVAYFATMPLYAY